MKRKKYVQYNSYKIGDDGSSRSYILSDQVGKYEKCKSEVIYWQYIYIYIYIFHIPLDINIKYRFIHLKRVL